MTSACIFYLYELSRAQTGLQHCVHTMDSITMRGCVYAHTPVHILLHVYLLTCMCVPYVFAFGICVCVQITSAHLYLCKGLYSNSSRATPVAVARTERIQKLSWQKLQYWMMARMVAQHKNMVTWREGVIKVT